ncbi:hypothetical protein L7F22_004672 [Adiantum nelumboides]|nr:hypothetical protein [Adiantum nelumboides]
MVLNVALEQGVAEDEVRVEKVSKVQVEAGGGGKRRVVFLTSCDLVCRSYPYINRVFFFKSEWGQALPLQAVSAMKQGLAKALVSFYPLAGRFCVDEEGRLQVMVADSSSVEGGAEFVEALCDLPFAALALDGFQYRRVFLKLAPRTHYLRCDYLHEPILSVQVTKFKDGAGYSVGVSMSHAVADAQSFYDFVRCWGEVCRGVAMSVPPLHMRDALSVSALFPAEKPSSFDPVPAKVPNSCDSIFGACEPQLDDQLLSALSGGKEANINGVSVVDELVKKLEHIGLGGKTTVRSSPQHGKTTAARIRAPIMEKQMEEEEHRRPRSDLVQKVFSFSSEKLRQLKDRANAKAVAEKASSNGAGVRHSTSIHEHECNGSEAVSKMLQDDASKWANGFTTFEAFCAHWWQCFIRARHLAATQPVFLLIPINCRQRFLDIPQSYFGNALDGGLVKLTAGEVCEAELGWVARKIHEGIKAATEEGFKQYIREAERKRNAIPHFDRTGLFHVVDSPKYPVYDVDFGFGPPQAVRAEGFRFGAEVQILAGRLGPGSYDLFCALDSHTMHQLEEDPSFLAC